MKKYGIAACVAILAITAGPAFAGEKYPRPSGYVNDFAGVLSLDDRNRMEALASELERKTSAEVSVVTVEDTGDRSIEEYATGLFEKWGIGKKGRDNGLLILVSMRKSEIRIETGYGIEGIMPDGLCGEIIRQKIVPAFKDGRFGEGLWNAVASSASIIAQDAGVNISFLSSLPDEYLNVKSAQVTIEEIIVRILFFIILFAFFGGRIFLFPFIFGGGFWRRGGGGFGGGFGGFGGGMSGGGGASGRW